jgi:hypothetical protein
MIPFATVRALGFYLGHIMRAGMGTEEKLLMMCLKNKK